MEDNFEQLSEDDFQDYIIAFRVIKSIEQGNKNVAGFRNSFTVVRNYLANVIARYAIDNL